jgi:hypothetical protein
MRTASQVIANRLSKSKPILLSIQIPLGHSKVADVAIREHDRSGTHAIFFRRYNSLPVAIPHTGIMQPSCATVVTGGDHMPAPAQAKKPLIDNLPLEEQIRRRAYELYIDRGNQSGSELDDWLQAEDEIRQAQEDALADES